VSRPAVWRWQRRYAEAGVAGLLRDKTRAPGKKPVAIETVNKVLALTCGDPPGETTHWTGRAMAKTVGLALHTVQRIWRANRLQPHRLRTFNRSTDPAFAEKVEDIVGLSHHPVCCPQHARRCRARLLHPKVKAWLTRHPRWVFHFTPTSGSWLNAVESFFSKMTRQRIRRGVFRSIADLQTAINRYLKQHNDDPKPFVWTKPADVILAKLDRLPVPSV